MKDLNGTKAAIRAGYSKNTARFQASRMLTNDNIYEHFVKHFNKLIKKKEVGVTEILEELKIVGFSNITDYLEFDNDGVKLKNSKKIDREKLKAIESIKTKELENGVNKSLKLYSKIGALSRLLDYLELQQDDDGPNNLTIKITRKRIK